MQDHHVQLLLTSHSQVRRVHCYEESYSVRELRFGLWSPREHHDALEALSLAAPEIRIHGSDGRRQSDNLSEFLACQNGMHPVDHWEPLERFTIIIGEVHELDDMRKYIMPSLKQRRNLGKPSLQISLFLVHPGEGKVEAEKVVLAVIVTGLIFACFRAPRMQNLFSKERLSCHWICLA